MTTGEGALSRLVTELKTKHGEVGDALDKRISEVTGEFSLDSEDSALIPPDAGGRKGTTPDQQ